MLKIENAEVYGWEAVVRGMRNPMNSWEQSDSKLTVMNPGDVELGYEPNYEYIVGEKDLDLMHRLRKAGPDHRKFMRMITVSFDLVAPLYWWKEFDTYKVGTVANSCSTMHKIHAKEFTLDDFSHEHLIGQGVIILRNLIDALNDARDSYLKFDEYYANGELDRELTCKKDVWWQLIQLLPSSYNQRRTVMLNYEVLANIYKSRKNHKLDEWHTFCEWIEGLPYSELITGFDGG